MAGEAWHKLKSSARWQGAGEACRLQLKHGWGTGWAPSAAAMYMGQAPAQKKCACAKMYVCM